MTTSANEPAPHEREAVLRQRLGIPADAARALIFAESSHWDPDWLYTSEEYFDRWVRANLDQAVAELVREPRRIYSVECMFFLRLYWDRCPAQRDKVRELINEGRLRLTSSGVTTADSLVPGPEAILRDWLLGQEWLRANGMTQEPRLAYFTDSFGCSPALPALLRAAGLDYTTLTRVDGMYFVGADYESAQGFPRPGSSAELLAKEQRTLDFIWRAPDGAEVLCHWNAFTYGQGDMLAHRGLSRIYIAQLALPARSDSHVAGRIAQYAAQLAPLSRTPYLFCPIGFDFVPPIPGLVELLDRYNQVHYPTTGVWAVNAGLDDYLQLVDCHRGLLPTLELDPNPYWTGFYTARPALKRQCHELVQDLTLAEGLALLPGNEGAAPAIRAELADAWWIAATANHHDFITGTSPDKVVDGEQRPWIERAGKTASEAITRLAGRHPAAQPAWQAELPEWRLQDGKLEVRTPHYTLELAEEAGGAIVRASDPTGQTPLLAGPSNDLVSYRDTGGLWRMGHEFRGGELRELARASDRPARLEVCERDGVLEVACTSVLDGEAIRRLYRFDGSSPLIRLRVEGRAANGRTVTVRLASGLAANRLAMDIPGGVAIRPPHKVYDPTFWPLQHFWHAQDEQSGRGLALCLRLPGAAACRPDGTIEAIALRNANRELAWGFLPIPATPATGHERKSYTFDYAVLFTTSGDWRENQVDLSAQDAFGPAWDAGERAALRAQVDSLVRLDRPEVSVIALKPAWRGEGIIVRLSTLTAAGAPVAIGLAERTIRAAFLCDARERDLAPLKVRKGAAHLTMPGAIATVRLLV